MNYLSSPDLSTLSFRQKAAVFICAPLMFVTIKLTLLIAGHDNIANFFTVVMTLIKDYNSQFLTKAARHGIAREGVDFVEHMHAMNAQLRPDTPWAFHKANWDDIEVMVFPRVLDSNTGLVTGPPDHPHLGAIVTNDGMPPNCDPNSLNHVLGEPAPSTQGTDSD